MRSFAGVWFVLGLAACGDDGAAPAIDRRCESCTADQVCLQSFDGRCESLVFCVAPGTGCGGLSIPDGPPCGTEIPGALTCYGP